MMSALRFTRSDAHVLLRCGAAGIVRPAFSTR